MNSLSPEQTEQLKEIGAHLRQLRQEQAISPEEVSTKTFIPLRLLKAIEEGQSDQLPEPVFIQGFIRKYADALDLDGTTLAKTFPANFLPIKADTYSQETSHNSYSSIQPYLPYILYILLVVSAAGGLLYLLNRPQVDQPPLEEKSSPVIQQKTLATSIPSSLTPPKTAQVVPPIEVKVNLKEQSWLLVVVDGKPKFEGIIVKGKQHTWTAKKQLKLRAGNAGAVSVSFNGQAPKLLGNLGEVKEVTFNPKK